MVTPSDNLVEIDNVEFAYGKRAILKGISLNVPRGKVVAIMGGSGCGKTTLLRLIGGQLNASKGAVRQFTKTVAIDCARKGYKVRCNSVHPGIIITPMGESILPNEKARERTRQRVPVGEFGTPEDIAYGVLYLISDESRFMTGAELVIDGGMNAI